MHNQSDSALLTKRVDVLPDGEREAAASTVDAEEDHGNILGGAHGAARHAGVAVVHVALAQRQRVVLAAGELLPLHHPAVKHLHEQPRGGKQKCRYMCSDFFGLLK